jgi:geranylgeranylglycerol-phosphate geranylgeranyltransferase
MQLLGLGRITRPVNSIVAGIAVLLGYVIAAGSLDVAALVLVPLVACITAAGNSINDYYDRNIDRINRPDRPIPAGMVTPNEAIIASALLFLSGLAITLATQNILLIVIALFNSLLLVLYAAALKGKPLIGNISVSYLAASIFLFGGAAVGTEGLMQTLPLAGITFFAMLARELLKDAEDMEGDARGGARTLPMMIGIRTTGYGAFACTAGAIIMSLLPVMRWWGPVYLGAIAIADLVILSGVIRALRCTTAACVRSSQATRIIKAGMFAALGIFIISALIL